MGNTVGDVAGLGLRDAELAHLMNSDTIALIDANIDSTKAKQIAKALRQNRTVRNVYLSWNSIGDQGAKAFAKTLQVNCYLKTLDLGSNNITDHGVHFLAAGIRRNKSLDLAELHLENNSISDEGASDLINAVMANSSITCLNLRDNLHITPLFQEEAATIGLRPALAASSDGFVFFEGVNVAGFPSLYALDVDDSYFAIDSARSESKSDAGRADVSNVCGVNKREAGNRSWSTVSRSPRLHAPWYEPSRSTSASECPEQQTDTVSAPTTPVASSSFCSPLASTARGRAASDRTAAGLLRSSISKVASPQPSLESPRSPESVADQLTDMQTAGQNEQTSARTPSSSFSTPITAHNSCLRTTLSSRHRVAATTGLTSSNVVADRTAQPHLEPVYAHLSLATDARPFIAASSTSRASQDDRLSAAKGEVTSNPNNRFSSPADLVASSSICGPKLNHNASESPVPAAVTAQPTRSIFTPIFALDESAIGTRVVGYSSGSSNVHCSGTARTVPSGDSPQTLRPAFEQGSASDAPANRTISSSKSTRKHASRLRSRQSKNADAATPNQALGAKTVQTSDPLARNRQSNSLKPDLFSVVSQLLENDSSRVSAFRKQSILFSRDRLTSAQYVQLIRETFPPSHVPDVLQRILNALPSSDSRTNLLHHVSRLMPGTLFGLSLSVQQRSALLALFHDQPRVLDEWETLTIQYCKDAITARDYLQGYVRLMMSAANAAGFADEAASRQRAGHEILTVLQALPRHLADKAQDLVLVFEFEFPGLPVPVLPTDASTTSRVAAPPLQPLRTAGAADRERERIRHDEQLRAHRAHVDSMRAQSRASDVRQVVPPVAETLSGYTVPPASGPATSTLNDDDSDFDWGSDIEEKSLPKTANTSSRPSTGVLPDREASQRQHDLLVQQKQAERIQELRDRQSQESAARAVRTQAEETVTSQISAWVERHTPGAWLYKKGRVKADIRKLLTHLHEVLPHCVQPGEYILAEESDRSDVKRLYRKALLICHPDKQVSLNATIEQTLRANAVFDHLRAAYAHFERCS